MHLSRHSARKRHKTFTPEKLDLQTDALRKLHLSKDLETAELLEGFGRNCRGILAASADWFAIRLSDPIGVYMQLLSVEQARQMLGLGRTAFYELLRTGALPAKKLGRRTFVIDDDMKRFIGDIRPYKPDESPDKKDNT